MGTNEKMLGPQRPSSRPGWGTGETRLEQKVNILLVDDQPSNLLALEAILQGQDRNFVKARSGLECLRCLLDDDFAVILMDVKMPGMDGFETAALIRQRERCQHTPIIFLTAFETNDMQMFKGYSLGAVDYLFKPIVPEVLRAKVAVFVEIFQKTQQVKQQSELLRQIQHQEHERQLAQARKNWETERLREEIRKNFSQPRRSPSPASTSAGHRIRPRPPAATTSTIFRCAAAAWALSSATSAATASAPRC